MGAVRVASLGSVSLGREPRWSDLDVKADLAGTEGLSLGGRVPPWHAGETVARRPWRRGWVAGRPQGGWGRPASQASWDRPRVCGGGTPRLFSWWPGRVSALPLPGQAPRASAPRPSPCVRAAPSPSPPALPRPPPHIPFPVWDRAGLALVRVSPPRPPRPAASPGGVLTVPEAGKSGAAEVCVGSAGRPVCVRESVLAGRPRLVGVWRWWSRAP